MAVFMIVFNTSSKCDLFGNEIPTVHSSEKLKDRIKKIIAGMLSHLVSHPEVQQFASQPTVQAPVVQPAILPAPSFGEKQYVYAKTLLEPLFAKQMKLEEKPQENSFLLSSLNELIKLIQNQDVYQQFPMEFLGQINSAMQTSKPDPDLIQGIIKDINKYLSAQIASASAKKEPEVSADLFIELLKGMQSRPCPLIQCENDREILGKLIKAINSYKIKRNVTAYPQRIYNYFLNQRDISLHLKIEDIAREIDLVMKQKCLSHTGNVPSGVFD
jgi:hypothetical protein